MLQLFEPSQQLVAALILGSCTLAAALVNAVAQMRVVHQARRKGVKKPVKVGRVRSWVVLGAAFALALGWSASSAYEVSGDAGDYAAGGYVTPGIASLLGGQRAPAGASGMDTLVVASIELRQPLADDSVIALLRRYELRPYALDFRLAERPESWLPVPVGAGPSQVVAGARRGAVRRAWQEACAYESVMAAVAGEVATHPDGGDTDSVAMRLIGARAEAARRQAERLGGGEPATHALRVLAAGWSASRAASDPAVGSAEIVRYDPGWSVPVEADSDDPACEVVQVPPPGEPAARGARPASVNPRT